MTITFKAIYEKSHQDTEFFSESEEFLSYVKNNYIDTGKCLEFRKKENNGLLQEVKSIWQDKESALEFQDDPTVQLNTMEIVLYFSENNIRILFADFENL
jgi:hypothetical protein